MKNPSFYTAKIEIPGSEAGWLIYISPSRKKAEELFRSSSPENAHLSDLELIGAPWPKIINRISAKGGQGRVGDALRQYESHPTEAVFVYSLKKKISE